MRRSGERPQTRWRGKQRLLGGLALALLCWALWTNVVYPQSELVRPHIPGYPTPDWQAQLKAASPKAVAREFWDLAFLAVATGVSSYLALWRRSRRGLLVLAGVSLLWLGFWRQGCICSIGAIQNVALTLADPTYLVPTVVVLVVIIPVLLTLAFGRTFCAAVCPLGAFQELVAVAPARIPRWVDESLGLFPYAFLGLVVLTTVGSGYFLACQYDPFVSFFRLGGSAGVWIFSIGFVLLGVVIARPYCRFLCPLGAVFRMVASLSRWHVRIPPGECINCRLCEEVCPYNAIRRSAPEAESSVDQGLSRAKILRVVAGCCAVMAVSVLGGRLIGPVLARLDWRVQLAERVWLEETGQVVGTTDASDVFRKSGTPIDELYRQAAAIETSYRRGGFVVGLWFGLVLVAKVVQLNWKIARHEYEPEQAKCYSCGRCFRFCPLEQARLGLIDAESISVYVKGAEKPQS